MSFVALDFETANYSRVSICSAGLAVFKNYRLVESPYWLVRPPSGYRWFREDFTDIHGLTWRDVQDAPAFPGIAEDLLQHLTSAQFVVAHNAQFDISALYATLNHFGLHCPTFEYVCTCQLARHVWPGLPNHKLSTLAANIGHKFNHHHAQSDAETAGHVILAMMESQQAKSIQELLQILEIKPHELGGNKK